MLTALKRISTSYQTPEELRENSAEHFALDYDEALEMAYENIQNEAKIASQGVKQLNLM